MSHSQRSSKAIIHQNLKVDGLAKNGPTPWDIMTSPERKYHNVDHLIAMLDCVRKDLKVADTLVTFGLLGAHAHTALHRAIAYHDIIYDPFRFPIAHKDFAERDSAVYYSRLPSVPILNIRDYIKEVKGSISANTSEFNTFNLTLDLILATNKTPWSISELPAYPKYSNIITMLRQWIVDADWAHYNSWETTLEAHHKIIDELCIYSSRNSHVNYTRDQILQLRVNFLQNLIGRFKSDHPDDVRLQNIEKEIDYIKDSQV